ncbi:MAG: hypothetical protein IKX50_05670 [Spirochaetia bacterium]|nr:hypothetical protein [Spirochaetia bacterium]MBR5017199.1 hypothetical protein [Spirochaetia bacterium]
MESIILYCKECEGVFVGAEGQASICPTCKTELVETHCSEEKWDSLSKEEKIALKHQWKTQIVEQKTEVKAEQSDDSGLDDVAVSQKVFIVIACAVLLIIGLLWGYGFCQAYSDIKNEEGVIVMAYRISHKGLNPISKSGYKTYLHNYPKLERQVKSLSRY